MAAVAVLALGLATNGFAEGPHAGRGVRVRGGRPNAEGRNHRKLDRELTFRADHNSTQSKTKVIVTLKEGAELPAEFKKYANNRRLGIINGQVLNLPDSVIKRLSDHPDVFDIRFDRPLKKADYRTALTTGGLMVNRSMGLTGKGIGIAVIDSGVAQWHDDLTNKTSSWFPYGNQRVKAFVDFVNGQTTPYDDEGHGTHVAGIIAGNGTDSGGKQVGVAPDASLIVLKVLDENGGGTISNIIAALDWVLANRTKYNIRVVNMSVGAGVTESYWTDPLTLAAKRVVDAGVVVVGAAGNAGKNGNGKTQYGAIVAPGNAPWVLTVGASSHQGTAGRGDDVMASFSSRGPTNKDFTAKPDLVAPGTGTVSLSDPWGSFYKSKAKYLLNGTVSTPYKPYLTLSGTSMAAPVVAGTVALMLQANPSLTPNAVKAILQYTAQAYPDYDALTQGAGFLNAVGAVRLAKFYATARPGQRVPVQGIWSRHIIWGNHLLSGGLLNPFANAFGVGTDWGVAKNASEQNIVWGVQCSSADCQNIVWGVNTDTNNIVWGVNCGDDDCLNIVWGTGADTGGDQNIVWGVDCGGDDCDNIIWGTSDDQNIMWGTAVPGQTVAWGASDDDENIVWGTADDDENIVWGTADDDQNIVWGTADDLQDIVWGTLRDPRNSVAGTAADDLNIVWGTDADQHNIVWGVDDHNNIVWGVNHGGNVSWGAPVSGTVGLLNWARMASLTDEQVFSLLTWMGGVQLGGGF
jgi:serine protease AprX